MLETLDAEFGALYHQRADALYPGRVSDVRIFGSRARGDAHEESDLDLFVMYEQEDPTVRRALMDLAWDVAYELDLPYVPSAHVMSRVHFERMVGLEMLFARDILEQGVPV